MLSTSYSDGTITLQNGWNLISIPKALMSDSNTVDVVFAGINTGGHSIFHYNGRTQYWDALQSSTVLKPLEGYYVYSVGAFTLNTYYVGAGQQQQQNPSVKLYQGWNMIGYFDPMGNSPDDYFHAAMARDELAQLGSSWASVQGFDPQTQQYETSITRGGSYSHSDYRLMYPEKGYWIWMNSGVDSWTISASHTYYCSAEWVSDYHGQQATLPHSYDLASGFYNQLKTPLPWNGRFIIGDNNGLAQKSHWEKSTDSNYIDNSHFALFSGHGGPDRIIFYHPNDENLRNLYYYEAEWGDGQVDWIALAACNVLNQSSYQNWQSAFKGLHSIVGWDTPGLCHQDLGSKFSNYMKAGNSIWESWRMAANDVVWEQNKYKVAILAADTDKDTSTRECIDDHIYGKGVWFSPPGYDLVLKYDTQPCV
ncbi:MAG: DUF6345 domain-containing protein [Methanolinea sp.]